MGFNTLQVFDAVGAGLHGIIAQVFVLATRVIVILLSAEKILFTRSQFVNNPCIQGIVLFFSFTGSWYKSVSPFDGPFIIIANSGKQPLFSDIVFGLRYVIEARIIHDGRGMAMFFYPRFVAQVFNRD